MEADGANHHIKNPIGFFSQVQAKQQ